MKKLLRSTKIFICSILCGLLPYNSISQIVVDAGGDTTICGGGSVTIGGSPTMSGGSLPYTYSWSPTAGLSNPAIANPVATVSTTTTYTVTTSDFNGRGGTDAVTISVVMASNVKFDPIPDACLNDTIITLTQGSPAGGVYSGPGIVISPALNPALAGVGNHVITYTYTSPTCTTSFSKTQNLLVDTVPSLSLILSVDTLCIGDTAEISVNGAATYNWQTSSTLDDSDSENVKVFPGSNTTYYVTGSSSNGCAQLDSIQVLVKECLPNGIQENNTNNELILFPNPGNGIINFESRSREGSIISILDASGKMVFSERIGFGKNTFDLRFLENGLYFVSVQTNKSSYYKKLIINK